MRVQESLSSPSAGSQVDAPVVIVSGLPRSGTSLLMQMLAAGGMPLLADGRRAPDEHNPRGYSEYEPVKRIEQDSSWLGRAAGRAVKIVVPLVNVIAEREVPALVLLVERDIRAVLASQKRMIEAGGGRVTREEQNQLLRAFLAELAGSKQRLAAGRSVKLILFRYEDILANPAAAANRMANLVPVTLDGTAMAAALDRSLNHAGR